MQLLDLIYNFMDKLRNENSSAVVSSYTSSSARHPRDQLSVSQRSSISQLHQLPYSIVQHRILEFQAVFAGLC